MTATKPAAPRPGLRERKKAKTRAAIREHALRLVREQGYAATTIEQIAEAAEVSPSTFFRYFPTKEDAILYDPYDPIVERAFRNQPPDLTPLAAMRGAMRAAFEAMPSDELCATRELLELIVAVPALRARLFDELGRTAGLLADLLAERVGGRPDDPAIVTCSWAVVGAVFGAMDVAVAHPEIDLPSLFDDALARLEAGLPLP